MPRFRWRAIIPLAVLLCLVVLVWWLFVDRVGRIVVQRGGTAVLGARVDVRSLHISLTQGSVTIAGLVAASPFDSMQNLVEAEQLIADIDVLPLFEKKVAIDRLAATGLRFGTRRTRSGFVPGSGGAAGRIMAGVQAWAAQPGLQTPVLQLVTGKLSIDSLDPRKLQTFQAAESLAARADSSARAWRGALDSLDVHVTADSAIAFAQRLQGAKPTDLALIRDARRMIDRVKQTRERVQTLERGVKAGATTLDQGLAALGAARARDYDFAKSLVRLPPIDVGAIGAVLFGPEATAKFQRALYYTQLAREYMPPGLQPRAHPAPTRRAGLAVEFPLEHELPGFLLRDAEISLLLGSDSSGPRRYTGRLRGLTSAPSVYGRPTTFDVRAPTVSADAMFDHVHETPRDALGGTVRGVSIPAIALPGLPIRIEPGTGDLTLGFALYGDSLRGRWEVLAPNAAWQRDSGTAGGMVADLLWRVVSRIDRLNLVAELGGTLHHPTLRVRSNLDAAVSDGLRAAIGDEIAAAEATLRARVDRLADSTLAPVRARVTQVKTEAAAQVAEARRVIEAAQARLEQQVRRLTGGIRLP